MTEKDLENDLEKDPEKDLENVIEKAAKFVVIKYSHTIADKLVIEKRVKRIRG
jgi:hypothetical protein